MSVKHLNQRQLAERWNVAEATLERWRSAGIGPVYLKLQGRVLYRVEDIDAELGIKPAKPSLAQFLKDARPKNPGASDESLTAYYNKKYGAK